MIMYAVYTDAGNMVSGLFRHASDAKEWAEEHRSRFYWRRLHVRTLPIVK